MRQLAVGWAYGATAAVCALGCSTMLPGWLDPVCSYGLQGSVVHGLYHAHKLKNGWKHLGAYGLSVAALVAIGVTQLPALVWQPSCLAGGISTLMAMTSYRGAGKSGQTRDQEIEKVRSLMSTSSAALAGGSGLAMSGGGAGNGGGGDPVNPNPGNNPSPTPSPADSEGGTDCNRVNKDFQANLNCALSVKDSGLPPELANPEFKKMLEKLSGTSADKLAGIQDPSKLIKATLGASLGADGKKALDEVLEASKQALLSAETPSSVYASAGTGHAGGAPANADALFDKLLPGEGGEQEGGAGPKTVQLGRVAAVVPSVAGDEENPGVSLFDRVQRRYRVVSTPERIVPLPYQSRENVMLLRQ